MGQGEIPRGIAFDPNGKAELPDERFKNADEVKQTCQLLIDADRPRSILRSRVDNLVNGFSTYPKGPLQKKGFGWFPRVNYRGAEGLIASQTSPMFDLVTEVPRVIEIDLDIEASSQEEKANWEETIADEFTWLLFKRWRQSFNYHLPLSQREMLVHGVGAHVWPNNRWTERTPLTGQILFPENASLDFRQELKYFMLRDFVPGEDVYQFIRNEDTARKLGWYPDNVWKALALTTKQNRNNRGNSGRYIDELQRQYRRGDIGTSNTTQAGLWLNWVFVAEYDGGISLYCVEENVDVGNKDGGYLYKKRYQFDEWPLVLFPYDIGQGTFHSVRGLGVRTKDFFELMNRITNANVAQVLISALPQFKQMQQGLDPDKLRMMRVGGMSIYPYGLEPAITQFPPLQTGGLALKRDLMETMGTNNQDMISTGTPEPKDRETALSFSLRSQDGSRVSNGTQSLYESNLQQYYDKKYRLLINTPKGRLPYQQMAQEFMDRCLKKGVPKEALTEKAIGEIREKTSTGSGSAAIRLHAITTYMQSPAYLNAPEDKQIALERSFTATLFGHVNVDDYARSVKDASLPPNTDVSFAVSENNGLVQGGKAQIAQGQNDVEHAQTHANEAASLMQAVQQGQMEPQAALTGLQALLDHEGAHLQRLQRNPAQKQVFDQLAAQWKQIATFTAQLKNQVESEQGQTPPAQELSEESQIEMQRVQNEGKAQAAKIAQHGQLQNQKLQVDTALKFRQQAVDNRLQGIQTAAKVKALTQSKPKALTR